MPNIMILTQAVLQIFRSQDNRFTMQKFQKGHNSATTSPTEKKKRVSLFSMLVLYKEFQDPFSNGS